MNEEEFVHFEETETALIVEETIEDADQYGMSSEDEEYDFHFMVDDAEYHEILKKLNAVDSDFDENNQKLKCSYEGCMKLFKRKTNLMKHLEIHGDRDGSICHICGKIIKGVLQEHLRVHDSFRKFGCDECGRGFRQKVALENHLKIHRGEKPFICTVCGRAFRQKYTMLAHLKTRHEEAKEHVCDLCGREFNDKGSLKKHHLTHKTTKPHQCRECFMTFSHTSSLSRHRKIHKNIAQCAICDKPFRFESFLKKHMQTAHSDQKVTLDYIFEGPMSEKVDHEIVINCLEEDALDEACKVESPSDSGQQIIQVQYSSH